MAEGFFFDEAGERPSASSLYDREVDADSAGHRLDYIVSRELGLSRAYAQRLIKDGRVSTDPPRRVKPSIKLDVGDRVVVEVPPAEKLDLEPEPVPFGVVFEDEDIIVVDKPAGVVVHPSPGHWRGTLVHGLLHRFPDIGGINGVDRPGIVHRLDIGTSGLMVVARNGLAHERLSKDIKDRRFGKVYIALCHGEPPKKKFRVDLPIARDPSSRVRMAIVEGGRDAVTDFEVLRSAGGYSLLKCVLHTGRTHQIRVHARAVGNPLVGDELYAPRRPQPFDPPRVFLHAWRLSFAHPRSAAPMSFHRPIPKELVDLLRDIW